MILNLTLIFWIHLITKNILLICPFPLSNSSFNSRQSTTTKSKKITTSSKWIQTLWRKTNFIKIASQPSNSGAVTSCPNGNQISTWDKKLKLMTVVLILKNKAKSLLDLLHKPSRRKWINFCNKKNINSKLKGS